jgi:hypothetical protein
MVRHYARSVGTLPNKGNNNGTVVQGAFKRDVLVLENLNVSIMYILGNVVGLDE